MKKYYMLLSILLFSCLVKATTLNLTFFIEGYYDNTTGLMRPVQFNQGISIGPITEVDNVIIELHEATSPFSLVASTSAMLYTNGSCSSNFSITGFYYIVINYCNTLETWSATPLLLTGSSVSYNFSDALSKAYDDNPTDAVPSMISLSTNPSIYGIISGDVNQDGNINLADLLLVEASITNQVIFCSDMNGDGSGSVNHGDLLDWFIVLSNNFQWVKKP